MTRFISVIIIRYLVILLEIMVVSWLGNKVFADELYPCFSPNETDVIRSQNNWL